jgi:hypothetical protein
VTVIVVVEVWEIDKPTGGGGRRADDGLEEVTVAVTREVDRVDPSTSERVRKERGRGVSSSVVCCVSVGGMMTGASLTGFRRTVTVDVEVRVGEDVGEVVMVRVTGADVSMLESGGGT